MPGTPTTPGADTGGGSQEAGREGPIGGARAWWERPIGGDRAGRPVVRLTA